MSIFFHIWILRGCVMLSLDLHTKSGDQSWPSLHISWSTLTLLLLIYCILRWCVMLSLDLHTKSADHPWPSLHISWSTLTLLLIYCIFGGCAMHIYSPRIKISLQAMELNGNFQQYLQQNWLVNGYNSCGLECFLGPYKWAVHRGSK